MKIAYLKTPRLGLPMLKAIQRDPLGMAQQFRRNHGDIVAMTILFQRIYYIFRPDAARRVLVEHHDHFAKDARQLRIFRSVQGDNVLTTEGPTWQRQRRILMPQFMPKKIAGYMALMADATEAGIAAQLPTTTGERRLVDVDRFTTRLTMDVILRTLFTYKASGTEADGISDAIRLLTKQSMRELFWLLIPPDWVPYPGRGAKLKSRAVLRDLIVRQVQARRANASGDGVEPPADLLGMLLAARDEASDASVAPDCLSDREIHDNCLVVFLAGHDTSATALTWWLGLMAANPHIAAQARDEVLAAGESLANTAEAHARLLFLNATLKEALRLYPPATATFSRVARRDVNIDGVEIPRRTIATIPIWNIHHDERWFEEPEVFRPERFMPGAPEIPRGAFLPFGAGPHFCLGQHFATAEMALIAAQLIRRYDLSFEPGTCMPAPIVDMTLKPDPRMSVRFTRR